MNTEDSIVPSFQDRRHRRNDLMNGAPDRWHTLSRIPPGILPTIPLMNHGGSVHEEVLIRGTHARQFVKAACNVGFCGYGDPNIHGRRHGGRDGPWKRNPDLVGLGPLTF